MENHYVNLLISRFISFIKPEMVTSLTITERNRNSVFKKNKSLYNYVILKNVLETEQDIQKLLEAVNNHLEANGRIIVIYNNYTQSFIRGFLSTLVRIDPADYNWLSTSDVKLFLTLSDFDIIVHQPLCLIHKNVPFISNFFNSFLLYIFPFNHFSFLQYAIARKTPRTVKDSSTSIIIPARNERGNIEPLFKNLYPIGTRTEIIFVEGHSKDNTKEEIERCIKKYAKILPFKFKLLSQNGSGKADAVRLGFKNATGNILIIYDADMSVSLPDLEKFYYALISHKGDFINGSRLVYPMEKNAMQFLNTFGNKVFSIIYSWIIGQSIKDTLCGTKVLWRDDYIQLRKGNFFGKYDPFGDFDLLIGASKLNLKIIDLPVRYYERTYGTTNIKRFKNAIELLRLSIISIIKLKMRK